MKKYYFINYDGMFSNIEYRGPQYEGEENHEDECFKTLTKAKKSVVRKLKKTN